MATALLIIRLRPETPVSGEAFADYLKGLSIAAHALSFGDPEGKGPAFETATYLAPKLPASPSKNPAPVPDAKTRITQHFEIIPGPTAKDLSTRGLFAVATAVIEIPKDYSWRSEYRSLDVRLVITRDGNEIVQKQVYYNVPVAQAPVPEDPNDFPKLQPVSLIVSLPAPGQQLARVAGEPVDASLPGFANLRTAMEGVLRTELGTDTDPGTNDIANLTREQCRHIAFEITWDPTLYPLPVPNRPLEAIYTGLQSAGSDDERDRRAFENELLAHYAKQNSEAVHLTNFVFAVSAAIWCEQETRKATQAGFSFPIFPAAPAREAKIILKGVETPLGFDVPAEYFYAITATLPQQITREDRFKMALMSPEAHNVAQIKQGLISHLLSESEEVNPYQAARRLSALGRVDESGTPTYVLPQPTLTGNVTPAQRLVSNWLSFSAADLISFWSALPAQEQRGHLDLLLTAITKADAPLIAAITGPEFGVKDVNGLAAKNTADWEGLLQPNPNLLPEFTLPGTTEERTQAFIRYLGKFFDVPKVFEPSPAPTPVPAPAIDHPAGNPLDALLANDQGFSFDQWDPAKLAEILRGIFHDDAAKQNQFTEWLKCIQGVAKLATDIQPAEIRFSVIEALWARGFTNAASIKKFSRDDFKEALAGSVAYDYADAIWTNAGGVEPHEQTTAAFKPVNPDGSIVNCVPPAHLSPMGPVAYLHDLLRVAEESNCDHPIPDQSNKTLAIALASRRGPFGNLLATKSNLDIPIPLIDIANESLEHMVAGSVASGAVYNTASDQLGGHELSSSSHPTADAYQHDPATMFEALPEHSTPAVPAAKQAAYDKLKNDFSACNLPYSQPLDVARTYLKQMGTSRYATMRRFCKDTTQFVLDPANETPEFQKHLYRYPVRNKIAIEYLGINPEEYSVLFQNNIPTSALPAMYGFGQSVSGGPSWTEAIVHLDEFLKRTCLSYCEFIELWKSKFVRFDLKGSREQGFPDCEPCCLDDLVIQFEEPPGATEALKRLAIFVRLWRKLQHVANAHYTFTELRDICEVLGLFSGANINPDFIRQLAAFQMFRDDFELSLTDGTPPVASATGADRMHLLSFGVPGAAKFDWAVEHLLNQIQQYAIRKHGCRCRGPEFIKLLLSNLDALSSLAGFDPNNPTDAWHARPTHTLRLSEILAKIYASEFGIGEILFLFTNDEHLDGDDPFPLQTSNEAHDSPLGLPDDEDENSLWTLRKKLLAVEVSADDAEQWSWARIENVLRTEFGFAPATSSNPWLSLGQHFFPSILAHSGTSVSPLQRQYRVALAATSDLMWNTPPDGPFHYDATAHELWTQVPLTDEAVLAKLGRIRQLNAAEQGAVQELYFLPRVELAHFALVFRNFGEAEERLIHEPDETKRWAWFQQQFAVFYQRCQTIAEHLAAHTACVTGDTNQEGAELAKLLLRHLWADENIATTPWENDNGQSPPVTWQSQPSGGAFAALLGLTGTGMLAEYFDAGKNLRWREVRGGADAFGAEENACNAPIPTVLPSMGFTFSPEQMRFAAIRNGFAMANAAGGTLGGAEPFRLRWKGLLLIEEEGEYAFSAGAPTPAGEVPDFEKAEDSHHWRIGLSRGQRTWVLLSHDWPNEEAPADCAKPIRLKKGFYELNIELERNPLVFDGPEDICAQSTGFQLKYDGPDSGSKWLAVPYDKLFQQQKDATLQNGIGLTGAAQNFLTTHYASTMRDMRDTYQRAFKAMLLAYRFGLSAERVSDDGQSELGYMLAHPINFAGQSYYRSGTAFVTHKAEFNLNFLPVSDNYEPPPATQDLRRAASAQRRQALFDCCWECLFDYTVMRRESRRSREQPAWLLFHESAESHSDSPADLVRHLGVDLRHDTLVLQYYQGYAVTSADLEDDRWAVRVWKSEKWIRALLEHFYAKDIRQARPDLWASDDPSVPETAFGTTDSGNRNLTQFYRDGCIENGEPRRYKEIKQLNDQLRERGRTALISFLTHLNRVPLPWGGFVTKAKHLSELLLIDVEAGLCQKASRIEEAVNAIQLFVQRSRLGLEPGFSVSPEFVLAWDRHFASFRTWEACKRRFIYKENWIEWDELQKAKRDEAFEFLESRLRDATLTMPVPGGATYWNGAQLPAHPGTALLQVREPATMQLLNPQTEGLALMGTPDRHARPTWLAPLNLASSVPGTTQSGLTDLPLWFQAAVRLGAKFIRVAAAGLPSASTTFAPKCGSSQSSACCSACGRTHPALMDEYYFWIEDSRHYVEQAQVAEWGATATDPQTDWHRPNKLPGLLNWNSKAMVHLRWSRVHNGEFQQPRQSYEGVWITAGTTPQLIFRGRSGDSLQFEVSGTETPNGYPPPPASFRYDLATDEAITLPQIVSAPGPSLVGGLASYPFFAWSDPGAPLLPLSPFSPAIAVASHLRAHCRFEAALKWYESAYNPLLSDNTWMICPPKQQAGDPAHPPVSVARKCCCASDPVSDAEVKERAILLHYLDTLSQWGDALMRRNTPEAFQQARLIFDTAARILGTTPSTVANDGSVDAPSVANFKPDCAPINPRLMCLYTGVNDRLALIHNCLNARRLKNGRANLDMPYFGNDETRDCCWKTTNDVCADESDWCAPQSPYRFMVLVQKALETAGAVSALGGALLSAYEKGDAEYLSTMRTMHERQLLNLGLEVRQNQWRQANWQRQGLQKTKEIAVANLSYYQALLLPPPLGLIPFEAQYEPYTLSSMAFRTAGNVSQALSQLMNLWPDLYTGSTSTAKQTPGTKMSMILSAAATVSLTLADIENTWAALGLTKAGWERRYQEWQHQIVVLTIEIEKIEREILAANRGEDVALRELNNQEQQIENAAEVHDFLRDKFTNHDLYLWLQQETAAIYYQMYEMALHCARQAERAFNFERGHTARRFIPAEIWDNLQEGLLSGERLQLAVRHMEKAYYDENGREYELTKHISLRFHFPMAFLQLRATGYCEIEIPEWMFDLDYPGHYMRRIKNVTMTIPCVAGPYTGVHCRLTLLSSKTRVDPRLGNPVHKCCHGESCQDECCKNGYETMPDDCRIVSMYAATEAIATSSGQNDSGMFELNFRDERYLPFEFSGAVSRWRIELPLENNHFDMETLSDLVLHLNFTAREGGKNLRKVANECAQRNLPDAGVRFFDIKREFPEAWHLLAGKRHRHAPCRELGLRLSKEMFPYLTGNKKIRVSRLEVLFEAAGADPSAHHIVEFFAEEHGQHGWEEMCDCDANSIACVADAKWPGLFHGVLDFDFGALNGSGPHELGVFKFPRDIGEITDIYLFCGYRTV